MDYWMKMRWNKMVLNHNLTKHIDGSKVLSIDEMLNVFENDYISFYSEN